MQAIWWSISTSMVVLLSSSRALCIIVDVKAFLALASTYIYVDIMVMRNIHYVTSRLVGVFVVVNVDIIAIVVSCVILCFKQVLVRRQYPHTPCFNHLLVIPVYNSLHGASSDGHPPEVPMASSKRSVLTSLTAPEEALRPAPVACDLHASWCALLPITFVDFHTFKTLGGEKIRVQKTHACWHLRGWFMY